MRRVLLLGVSTDTQDTSGQVLSRRAGNMFGGGSDSVPGRVSWTADADTAHVFGPEKGREEAV